MPKVRALVTITSEAVVDVPDGADNVDEFLRDQVSLSWGEALVARLVHEDVSVAFYPVEEPVEEPVVEAEPPAAPEPEAESAATIDEVERALALAEASIAGERASLETVAIEPVEPAAADEPAEEASPRSEFVPRVLTRDEVLSLFTDPLYSDMIRSAVRGRAEEMIEAVVAEVVSELEPLIRRQAERRRPSGA